MFLSSIFLSAAVGFLPLLSLTGSILHNQPLVGFDAAPFNPAFSVRQHEFHVALVELAQAEMGDRLLTGSVPVPGADLAGADECRGLSKLTGGIHADDGADPHPVHPLARRPGHVEPVA